jgi:hypothetical protein
LPFPILNASAVIQCCHGGKVTVIPGQQKVLVGGAPALVLGDIAGSPTICPVVPSGPTKPCTTATVPAPAPGTTATKVFIEGRPVHASAATLVGITDGAPVPCPTLMVTYPGQTKVMAT